jgi:V/A-type H+-transporting ATPase subunit B
MIEYNEILEINGDIVKVRAKGVGYNDLAVLTNVNNDISKAQVIALNEDIVTVQVFSGGKGISTGSRIRFLGHPVDVVYTDDMLGRIFNGSGEPIDGGPSLENAERIEVAGPSVNPAMRVVPSKMIRTNIPMIDLFNTLVESQKIPIFSVAGEPYNELLARIGTQADAEIIVFVGMGLIYDDYIFFRETFEKGGMFDKTVMFVNLASDPIVERLLAPDLALGVAEKFAVEQNKKVLVLITDMTAYADAMKEIGVAMEQIPSNRGYMGDLYSQLAFRYERACDYQGAGSVTLISATTMPGDDVTHPVPDNTGYITEGQFYLHHGVLDPFGSLSRLKQLVIGEKTREDHSHVMNTMIRLYSSAKEAEQKQAMAFELSEYDHKLLRYGSLFLTRFMDVDVDISLEKALDLGWQTMAECFTPEELLMKEELISKYYPKEVHAAANETVTRDKE